MIRADSYSSSIINELSKEHYNDSTVGIAFFYCDGNYPEKQDVQYILGSIARQLFIPSRGSSAHFKHLQTLRTRIPISLEVLLSTMEMISSSFNRVYIIVDGLDECANRKKLLHILSTLKTEKLNLFLTSRYEKDIEIAFRDKEKLAMDEKCIQTDIGKHIEWMLEQNPQLSHIKPQLKQDIKTKLMMKSNGM